MWHFNFHSLDKRSLNAFLFLLLNLGNKELNSQSDTFRLTLLPCCGHSASIPVVSALAFIYLFSNLLVVILVLEFQKLWKTPQNHFAEF